MNRCADARSNGEMNVNITGKLVKQIGKQYPIVIFRYVNEMTNLYLVEFLVEK
jgi:hypothetical protein